MRKKIAIYIGEIGGAFQHIMIQAITAKANALGYDVVAICSFGSYNYDILYAEGEKASINLADPSMFDGIIVTEDLFDNPGMEDELYEKLKKEAKCPVVYLRTHREGLHGILLENYVSMERMVRHFTDDHGFTDICYMSGKAGNYDAAERLRAFMDVMKEKNIPVTEHMIFHGDFWRDKGREAVNWFMEGRDSYPQVIICANDYMALSVCDELRNRGIRVPEDVCVSGFDFIDEARAYEPTMTSLEVDFEGMSERAISIIDNVNNGKDEEYIQYMPAKLVLNKSCGCGEQRKFGDVGAIIAKDYRKTASMKNNMLMGIEYQDCFEIPECMAVADKFRDAIKADKAFFCMADTNEQGFDEVENDSLFTEQMILTEIFEEKNRRISCNKTFARRELLPKEFFDKDEPSNYFFFTIHFKNIVYGYMATDMPKDDWFDIYTQAYLISLANAIENCNVHSRMEKLEEIRSLYQKDALTGLYNRRGFDKLLRDKFMKARANNENFGIASIDMDNLKIINDGFGHASGDIALKALANALSNVIEDDECAARIGGDEFAAIINIKDSESQDKFKTRLKEELNDYNKDKKDFEVGASIGICEVLEVPDAPLIECLKVADMRMYEDKKTKKNHR
ncbi:MAG: GGDEF domain-containing protein [Lachnospiraceae bacterium]|nr:GGDEF domain-containing protein [Lachnospiraceae bacterium]